MLQHIYPPEFAQSALTRIPTPAELARPGTNPSVSRVLKVEDDTLIWTRPHPQDAGSVVVKMYRHRGPISRQREKMFQFRVEREHHALARLERCGVPCSPPVFWGYGSDRQHGRYELLCTREVVDATPLSVLVSRGQSGAMNFSPLFRTVRRMHEAGLYHGRLDLRNILCTRIESGVPRFHIIDTPQAIAFPGDITGTRMAWFDLVRLVLSMHTHLSIEHCNWLLADYGLDRSAIRKIRRRAHARGISKLGRNLTRFEFGLRLRIVGLGFKGAALQRGAAADAAAQRSHFRHKPDAAHL